MSIPSTYTALSSGIRTAQALYEADYNDAYVYDALVKKGYDNAQAVWIMKSAEVENVEHRKKSSLLGVIIFGAAWVIIFTILFFVGDVPETHNPVRLRMMIPTQYWIIAGGVFLGSVANYIYAVRQVARVKREMPPHPGES